MKPTKLAHVLGSGWERKKRIETDLIVFGLNSWKDEITIFFYMGIEEEEVLSGRNEEFCFNHVTFHSLLEA